MQRVIRKIQPIIPLFLEKKRVCAYARVSSGKDAMIHSLSAQVSYYSSYIQEHFDWEFAGVYADEALSGTKDDREQFQKMLEECRNGNIDMIIAKSISRLARNTVTMLQTVRELKALNVEVYFEKEDISSMSKDGELMLTVLSSFAQEESYNVSENCKWYIRKSYNEGKARINNKHIFGYIRTDDFGFKVVKKEARIVKMIFDDYLSGMGICAIRDKLNDMNVKTIVGNNFHESSIREILLNELYMGDLLLQKYFVKDHITKKKIRNDGQLKQYYVEDNHDAIVTKETFYATQAEMKSRAEKCNVKQSNQIRYPFSGKILCMNCGKNYKRRTLHANDKYRRVFWNCSTYLRLGKSICYTKQIPEDILYKVTSKVLGLEEFDETVFNEKIQEIQVSEFNKLKYIFKDGLEIIYEWSDNGEC